VPESGAGADTELAVDPPEVHFDRFDAEEQWGGDLPVAAACDGELGDLQFLGRERVDVAVCGGLG